MHTMKNMFNAMAIMVLLFLFTNCKRNDSNEVQSIRIVRKSDKIIRFESIPISKVIIDKMGGIIVPFDENESKILANSTSINDDQGHEMMIYIGNDLMFEMELYPGIANGFIYFRGNIRDKIKELKISNVRIIEVNDLPMSSTEVKRVIEIANEKAP